MSNEHRPQVIVIDTARKLRVVETEQGLVVEQGSVDAMENPVWIRVTPPSSPIGRKAWDWLLEMTLDLELEN